MYIYIHIYIYIYIQVFVLRPPPSRDHLSGKETNEKLPYIYIYIYIYIVEKIRYIHTTLHMYLGSGSRVRRAYRAWALGA